ncbi:MAG: zinc-binding dehydrogenase [Ignavibacteriae bacterium]|nr:zinc-binding dehydrogenase [Ignavibacteriota bacterium]
MNYCKSKIISFDSIDNSLKYLEVEIPQLTIGEILVKNEYVTLCRSDINTYIGKRKEKNPTILGHEIVGKIVEFADGFHPNDILGNKLNIGDRITWGIYSSNPDSYFSKIGIPQKGENLFKYGHEELTSENTLHGGLAEFIIIRKNTPVIKLNNAIPLKIAATINCSVATVAGAIRIAGNINHKKILIIGVGMLGIIACAMANSLKANSVASCDISKNRLNDSLEFGATNSILFNELEKLIEKYDLVFDFSGIPDSMEIALDKLEIGGTAIFVGATYPQRKLNISAEKLIRNIHTIKGLHNYNSDDLINAVKFIEENLEKYPFEKLVVDKYNLNQTFEAFNCAITENPYRVGISIYE